MGSCGSPSAKEALGGDGLIDAAAFVTGGTSTNEILGNGSCGYLSPANEILGVVKFTGVATVADAIKD